MVDEKKCSGEGGIVIKIDFQKAYNPMDWDFFNHVLMKGFITKWKS